MPLTAQRTFCIKIVLHLNPARGTETDLKHKVTAGSSGCIFFCQQLLIHTSEKCFRIP